MCLAAEEILGDVTVRASGVEWKKCFGIIGVQILIGAHLRNERAWRSSLFWVRIYCLSEEGCVIVHTRMCQKQSCKVIRNYGPKIFNLNSVFHKSWVKSRKSLLVLIFNKFERTDIIHEAPTYLKGFLFLDLVSECSYIFEIWIFSVEVIPVLRSEHFNTQREQRSKRSAYTVLVVEHDTVMQLFIDSLLNRLPELYISPIILPSLSNLTAIIIITIASHFANELRKCTSAAEYQLNRSRGREFSLAVIHLLPLASEFPVDFLLHHYSDKRIYWMMTTYY